MNCTTLEELCHHFLSQLSVLAHAQQLSEATIDDNFVQNVRSLHILLDEIKQTLKVMRKGICEAKAELEQNKKINIQIKTLLMQVEHATNNLPSRLPKIKVKPAATEQESEDHLKMTKPVITSNDCRYLRFLTVQEFELVPKYMKGRLTYDKVNQTIEMLDKAYIEKYKLLSQKKSALSDMNRKRHEVYRSQESKDTKGIRFIVDKDISEFTSLKLDVNTRTILTILRHCGLMHEIRGGGVVRYGIS